MGVQVPPLALPSDERTAFCAGIWARPDDDLPRLVFADWLDKRGETDAATFLRLLCTVRTCPPDLDKLRPLVADLRRAMVKAGPRFVEDACPVPPSVVVGPWVDVDHAANQEPFGWVRKQRREWVKTEETRPPVRRMLHGLQRLFAKQDAPQLYASAFDPPADSFVEAVWGAMLPVLTPAAVCAIEDVPVLVDVWSGVMTAVAMNDGYCRIRKPSEEWGRAGRLYHNRPSHEERWSGLVDSLGPLGDLMEHSENYGVWEQERKLLEGVVAEFDPANGCR